MQGKSRPQEAMGEELRIGIAYEGWEPRYEGSENIGQ